MFRHDIARRRVAFRQGRREDDVVDGNGRFSRSHRGTVGNPRRVTVL